jgi:beta-phosphoglucomutase-like phosphatase (HAD superfamily)
VVEDAEAGITAAKAGGFTAIGIGSAAEDPNADYAIQTFADLLNIANG